VLDSRNQEIKKVVRWLDFFDCFCVWEVFRGLTAAVEVIGLSLSLVSGEINNDESIYPDTLSLNAEFIVTVSHERIAIPK